MNETETTRFAVFAHDLKAPLSSIIDLLGVIDKGYVADIDHARTLVTRAKRKAETLFQMIDDIMDYTLLSGESRIKREKLNPCDILIESISIVQSHADGRGLSLSFNKAHSDDCFVRGNYTFLLRCFNNVLMNAIKYNRDNGTISVRTYRYSDNELGIEIDDTGIGIASEELKFVFEMFKRGKQAGPNIDGSLGLGLSLVKKIITDHRGAIEISSTVNVGTRVLMTLPVIDWRPNE